MIFKSKYTSILTLGLVIFVAHYFQVNNFGLYEDDYIVSAGMSYELSDLLNLAWNSIISFQRPVAFIVYALIPYITSKFGGTLLLHLTGFFIVWLNASLIYLLIAKCFDKKYAFLGALIYVLLPALTIRGWLNHTTHMQPTITYLLCALLFYINNKKTLSYLTISLSLMTYELGILPFFLAPFFAYKWDKSLVRKLAIHIIILFGMMTAFIALRVIVQNAGDSDIRVLIHSPFETAIKIIYSIFIGPYTSLISFYVGPAITFKDILKSRFYVTSIANLFAIIPLCALLFYSLLNFFTPNTTPVSNNKFVESNKQEIKLVILGFLALFISYAMAFTHYPPKWLFGTGTAIHTSAAFAWSLLGPGIVGLIFNHIQSNRFKKLLCLLLSFYLSALILFHVSIQSEYVKSAKMQSQFWNAVIKLCPDLSEGTVIFYDRNDLTELESITTYSWAMSVTLEQIYQFPSEWKTPPRVFPIPKSNEVSVESKSIDWFVPTARWWAHWTNTPTRKIIFLRHENNEWIRKNYITLNGNDITLSNPTTSPIIEYPKGLIWENFQR
jgi:hypothetical protein